MASEWQTLSLAEVYDFSSGLSKPRSEFGSGHPFLSFKDVFYNSAVPKQLTELVQSTEQERERCSVMRGDVFLTRTSETMDELGMSSVALADIPNATFNGFTKRLRPKRELVAPGFARYFFRSSDFRAAVNSMSTMSTRASLNNEMLERLTIRFPGYVEQEAIAHILGTLDDKIELNRKQNETLEAMARALFKAWFVDFEPVRAKMDGRWQRGQSLPGLPAHLYDLFPDRLDDNGKPKGWKMIPANELIEFNPTEPLRKGTPAPYLDMASLPTSGSWPKPPIMRDFGSGMRFRNGDTLLARITPCLENGKATFVQCLSDNTVGWGSTEYIVMRSKAPVPSGFCYLLARDSAFRELAIQSMTGTSGRQRVQASSVTEYEIAAPTNEGVWDAFSQAVSPPFTSIKANAEVIVTLAQLRDILLPRLESGRLKLSQTSSSQPIN